jgi:YebC/PmpR family DNA-binding regulatory protein
MSGHSKWSTIKRKKSAEDSRRGKVFTRLTREIMIAARSGGDLSTNSNLRLAVEKAKAANMPKDNIERAIKKGSGELEGGEMEEVTYEGYAPHGVALLVQCLTDNRNRTLAEVRRVFNRQGGNMAEAGAVTWLFDAKGYITLARGALDPEDVFMIAADAGADDVEIDDETIEIYTPPDSLHAVVQVLEDAGIIVEDAELLQVSQNQIALGRRETLQIMGLIEAMEELDDVQRVCSNLKISAEALLALAAA